MTIARSDTAASWPVRVAALFGVAGLLLTAHQAGQRTSAFDNGWRGAALSWTSVGSSILIAGIGFLLYRPWAAAHLSATRVTRAPSVISWWTRMAVSIYPAWWIAALCSIALVKPGGGPRQILASLVLFRDPRAVGPLAGTSIGWVLFIGLCGAACIPIWSSIIRYKPRSTGSRLRRELLGVAALAVIGTVWRLVCLQNEQLAPFGPTSQLPGQLVVVALGMFAAIVHSSQSQSQSQLQSQPEDGRKWIDILLKRRRFLLVGAIGLWLVGVLVCGDPEAGHDPSAWQFVGRHWIEGLSAALLVLAAVVADPAQDVDKQLSSSQRSTLLVRLQQRAAAGRGGPGGVVRWLAILAPGVVLLHEPVSDLVARQYRERVTDLGGTRFVTGPATPVFVWSALIIAAIGIIATVIWTQLARRRNATTYRIAAPFVLRMAGVGAAAFVWRFVALLGIAPERTDGGDPLFYHTTANLLAEGRGFPEPLNWIAHGRVIPSAIHGPMYPMVLSIASRFGGRTYFDHKMVSLLIGTATVVCVGAVARRLGGDRVALVAAALAACYPNLWAIDTLLFPEGLFALCTTLVILVAYRWRDDHRIWQAGALGALIGIAALARGEGIFLSVFLAIPWMIGDRTISLRDRWRHLIVAGVVCLATLLPWTVRNMVQFEVFVPLSTNGQELLVYANCDETYSGKFLGFWLFDCQDQIRAEIGGDPPGDEAEKAKFWGDQGRRYAQEHIGQLPKVVAARIGRQWDLFRPLENTEFVAIEGRSPGWAKVGLAYYYALAALSVAGVMQLRRRGRALLPLLAQVISVTVTAAYAYGNTRFRASAEPVLCILGAVALVPLLSKAAARWNRLAAASIDRPTVDGTAFVLGGSGAFRSRHTWRRWLDVGVILAFVAAPLRGMYLSTGSTMEEGFMLTFPERVLAGDIANVDFLHLYGPGSLHALAGVYRIFGVDLFVERSYGLVQHLGIIFGIYALLRAWGRLAAVGGAILSTLLVLSPIGLTALAWNGAVALGLWSVVAALRARAPGTRRPERCWVAAGLLAGLALTFRPDLVLALGLAHVFLVWRTSGFKRLAIGSMIGLLPFIVHVALAGPTAVIDGMLLDPVRYLRPGRTLPQPPSWTHFDGALQIIADKFPNWWEVPHITGPQQLFVWFFSLPIVAFGVLAVGIALRRRTNPESGSARRLTVLIAGGLFSVGILQQAFQRPDSAHFGWVACVSFPMAVAAIIEVVAHRRPSAAPLHRAVAGILVVAASYLVIFPFFSYRPYLAYVRQSIGDLPQGGLKVERNGRTFYLGDSRPWIAAKAVVADLDTLAQPGERLLVGPADLRQTTYSDVFFYYLFPELTPATYYIEMDPGLANAEGTRLTGDVESADWLILTRYWSGWIEPNTSIEFGDDRPNQAVEAGFCLRGTYENDLVRLYQRCSGGDGTGPYEGPYEPEFDYAVEVSVPVPPRPDGTSPFAPGPFVAFDPG